MAWNQSNGTIFYTSELSLNTAYELSSNTLVVNAISRLGTANTSVNIAIFNVSLGVNSMNSEMYASNISTNTLVFNSVFSHQSYAATTESVETDTQVWFG